MKTTVELSPNPGGAAARRKPRKPANDSHDFRHTRPLLAGVAKVSE